MPERSTAPNADRLARRNRTVAAAVIGCLVLMIGASYAAVPLYRIFCQVTGYGGTTQRAEGNANGVIDRVVTVRFDANVNNALPWRFGPEKRSVTLRMGETMQVAYLAENLGSGPTVGTSVFNVTPLEAGAYFNKVECFCFTEQKLAPGESAELPVVFFVDPAMDEDKNLKHVKEITLSYTFYPADAPAKPVAAAPEPDDRKDNL